MSMPEMRGGLQDGRGAAEVHAPAIPPPDAQIHAEEPTGIRAYSAVFLRVSV